MTSPNDYSRRAIVARLLEQIDLAWREKYERFLDYSGREPRPIDGRSLVFIAAFFVLSWGLSTWQGLVQLTPAIATTTIVSIASLRFSNFDRAYRQYLEQRAQVTAHVAVGFPVGVAKIH